MEEALDQVLGELAELYAADDARLFLCSPNELLGGAVPIALIRSGRGDVVLRLIRQIRDGAYL